MEDTPTENVLPSYPYPSDRIWFDPMLINAASEIVITSVTLAPNVNAILVPASGRRWALGFFQGLTTFPFESAPWPDVGSFVFGTLAFGNSAIQWFKLFDYGPLVCSQWWGHSTNGGTLRVVQLLRN